MDPIDPIDKAAIAMPTRIALLGSGLFATKWYLPVLVSSPEVVLHALWSRSPAGVETLSATARISGCRPKVYSGEAGLSELLADDALDAVIMALPITVQPDIIVQCWKSGKHVISEKPVAADTKSARDLIRLYEKEFEPRGIQWRVAENYAHEPGFLEAAKILQEEALGGVLYWQLRQENFVGIESEWLATPWRTKPEYQGGFILDAGVHMAAVLRVVLPDRPQSVVAISRQVRPHLPPADSVMALVQSSAVLSDHAASSTPAGNVVGTMNLSWAAADIERPEHDSACVLDVMCANGRVLISVGSLGEGSYHVIIQVTGVKGGSVEDRVVSREVQGVKVEVEQFCRAIQGLGKDEANLGRPQDALWDLAFIEALLSVSEGKVVVRDLLSA